MTSSKGLVLTGGGARGAYQAGVLSEILNICHEENIKFPFQFIHGISAGSINAAFLASNLYRSSQKEISATLDKLWCNLKTEDVINTNALSLTMNGLKWAKNLSFGGIRDTKESLYLLDNKPLRNFLSKNMDMNGIEKTIAQGFLKSISISMTSYSEALSKSYFQGNDEIKGWRRVKREGVKVHNLTIDYVMASSSIPLVFPPVKIGSSWYGDGSLRDYTPLSPAIKMGAEKILVIGVRKREQNLKSLKVPTPAKILGTILNGILLDGLDTDLERLSRINKTIAILKQHNLHDQTSLKQVDTFVVTPSEVLSECAKDKFHLLPKTIQYLINGIGGKADSSDLISYILFESAYTRELFSLGKNDVKKQRAEILNFVL